MLRKFARGATNGRRPRSPRGCAAVLGLAGVVSCVLAFGASPALAGVHAEYARFYDCPLSNPKVVFCVVSVTTSGEFKLGSKEVPVNKTVTLQGGLESTAGSDVLVPAADGNTLSKTPLEVPGGIVGIEILGPLTGVTATAELAGSPEINITNANRGEGVATSLPVKVKLGNALLGEECYLGSDSEPVKLNLTTGRTSPPPPNTPISGSTGVLKVEGQGLLLVIEGSSLVDNAFAAPGANGCAGVLAPVVDAGVDLDTGLPAAAGHNTAILNGNLYAAGATAVREMDALPQLGRCVKTTGVKEGKETHYSAAFIDAACTEGDPHHEAPYEWSPGPGAAKGFTTSSGSVTLETTGKTKVTCTSSSGHGEYTGAKTATVQVTFAGCKAPASKQSCSSAGASSGEIVAAGLQEQLGFITDTETTISVGWDLTHSPVISAQCGSEALSVTGSAIAPVGTIEKMTSSYTQKYKATGGKQAPEAFEEEAPDTLSLQLGSKTAEQAGLTTAIKVTNEEKIEIRGEYGE